MENLKYTEILQLNKSMVGKINSKPYTIGVLSNVTVNSFKEILEYNCRINQIEPQLEIGNFDNIVQDSAVFNKKDLVVIFYDTLNIVDSVSDFFEDLNDATYANLKQKLFTELSIIFENLKTTPSVIFNLFSDEYFPFNFLTETKIKLFVNELNKYVEANAPANFKLIDINRIFSQTGFKQSFDNRFYLSSKAPYTVAFLKNYVLAIENIILKNCGKLKKAVIFDCDNTLWKGIIGEDGMENIDMSASSKHGAYFHNIQKLAVYLSKRGIIVGLCSKNNEADVLEVLRTHKDMVLKEEHIVITKVNWQDKASNLRAIAEELNIGVDSLVFIDDSSFEINLIKEQLPEVLALQVPTTLSEYPDLILKYIYRYFNLTLNSDDVKKTQMYKEQFQRENAKTAYASIEDYLASLEIELKILKDDNSYVPRIAQLTQKTNQFNLTTYRYTESQVEQFMASDKQFVFAMFVKDKFGDNGLTGVCIIKENEKDPKNAVIDSLLMSCRIIGRNIEYVYVNTIIENIAAKGYESISAQFIPTKKNAQVESFYENVGLQLKETKDGAKEYQLDIRNFSGKKVDYIKVINN
ncbi:MAG: HAD-IIIC family phosphatase [Bacteroidetes bacterium]|nr:HAD-IIIC family phosphatase [Bacteroidota bacterium]